MKVSEAVDFALMDPRPDKQNHLTHLVITRRERADLLHKLKFDFGPKLQAKNENSVVAAAGIMDDFLHKDFKSSDDPW